MRALTFYIRGGGSMAKQQKPHVQWNENSMQRHIIIHNKPTYFSIPHVEKIAYPTWKRTPKQTQIAKCNVLLKQLCGS
jgi:hypothetical protein